MKKSLLFLSAIGSSVAATTLPLVILTSCNKAEAHSISAATVVEKTEIIADKKSIGGSESDEVKLTITNSRTSEIIDANLTIKIGSKHVNIKFDTPLSVGTTELTFNKKTIQEKFTDYTIGKNDSFEFKLVRSGAYSVEQNRLYKFDDFGNSTLATENEIKDLDKAFLVQDKETSDLVLSDSTYSNFIMNLKDDATIYLIYGTYYHNDGTGPTQSVRLTIHGICDEENNPYAGIQVYHPTVEAKESPVKYNNVELNLFNLKVIGRPNDGTQPWISDSSTGIMATPKPSLDPLNPNDVELRATNCAFSGAYMIFYHHSIYTNCTFDSTNSLKPASGGFKNNYPMFIYAQASAEFEKCTFKSAGKAVKIYTDGQDPAVGFGRTTYTFHGCEFNLQDTPWCVDQEFPINIHSTLYTLQGAKVYIDEYCKMNQKWIDTKGNSLYGIEDDLDEDGYYKHILINDQKVAPPAII